MKLTVVTPPATEPLSLVEVKEYLRIDGTDQDAVLGAIIKAARRFCENVQRQAYITQTLELALDAWPREAHITLPRAPLRSVTAVTYTDKDGAEAIMPPSDYIADTRAEPGQVVLAYGKNWPSVTLQPVNGVVIRYEAGYGTAATTVPETAKQAMWLLVGHWNERREAVLTGTISKEIEFGVNALLWQDRTF